MTIAASLDTDQADVVFVYLSSFTAHLVVQVEQLVRRLYVCVFVSPCAQTITLEIIDFVFAKYLAW